MTRLSLASLSDRLQEMFQAEEWPGVTLQLGKVVDVGSTDQYERFSAQFHGPPHTLLPQQIYRLNGERGDQFELFLVPIAGNQDGYTYEAVFNRLRDEAER